MGNFSTTDLAEDVKHALWSVVKRSRQLHWRNLHEPPLEGHNASNYEKTQAHIQRNWETIRQLRQDNKKLNERLSEVNTVSPCLPPSITFNYVFVKKKKKKNLESLLLLPREMSASSERPSGTEKLRSRPTVACRARWEGAVVHLSVQLAVISLFQQVITAWVINGTCFSHKSSCQAAMETLDKKVLSKRKILNNLKHDTQTQLEQLEGLQQEFQRLQRDDGSGKLEDKKEQEAMVASTECGRKEFNTRVYFYCLL